MDEDNGGWGEAPKLLVVFPLREGFGWNLQNSELCLYRLPQSMAFTMGFYKIVQKASSLGHPFRLSIHPHR